MTQKQIERRSLIVSTFGNLISTIAGLWIFAVTGIQALFLDCFFSCIAFLSCIAAVVISKKSKQTTASYPEGMHFLEPSYAILKSLLTLGLLIFSTLSTGIVAWRYFVRGIGEPMNVDPVFPYSVAMVALCFALCLFNSTQNRKMNGVSTMLTAEAKTNFIDGIQSLGIGIAAVLLGFIEIDGPLGFLHYTGDFFITFTLVVFSIGEPLKVIAVSFKELSGGSASNAEMRVFIHDIVDRHIDEIGELRRCDVFKIGTHIKVRLYLHGTPSLDALRAAREKMLEEISTVYEDVEIIYNH